MNESNNFADTYRQEAEELLETIEQTVLELEENPDDSEAVNRLFRAMHTIKGSGSMFGFDDIAEFTHHVETVLDKVREHVIPVSRTLIDLILRSRDQISAMVHPSDEAAADPAGCRDIIDALNALHSEHTDEPQIPKTVLEEAAPPAAGSNQETTYRIRFRPASGIFASGMDPELLINELEQMGTCQVTGLTESIPELDRIDPEACYIQWDIVLTTCRDIDAVRDAFIFVEDGSRIRIDKIAEDMDGETDVKRLGEILVQRGEALPDQVESAAANQRRIGDILTETGIVSREKIQSALVEQNELKRRRRQVRTTDATVRVPADKLDRLINLVGELVIVQARLSQVAGVVQHTELDTPVEEVERLTGELRDCALNIRMLPIGTTFSRFKRLVRDLSGEMHKEIDLITEGGATELDKTVIDRLGDPLVHLIRNSIDHGIEPPDQRERMGKPRRGSIRLSAAHVGAHVVITVEDDGKGLDSEVIRAKAVEKGLIGPEDDVSGGDLLKLIFEPGFSTAQTVTSVSGRGVGMDVVKREIDALRGHIEISGSRGQGAVMRISLPLTLAIIDGLLVKAGRNRYVLPLALVNECVELSGADIDYAHGRHLISVRGELVPYVRLREVFRLNDSRPGLEHIAIVEVENMRVGIVVDEIIGNHQTVIKSLGPLYKDVEGVSGATILGDGGIALILDMLKLVRSVQQEEQGV